MALGLIIAATGCGGDSSLVQETGPATTAAVSTSTTTTSTVPATQPTVTAAPTTAPTTTTTYPWDTHQVPATMRCVIGHLPGDDLNVRTGPAEDHDIVGTLPHDAAGFTTTGVAALDDQDREWIEITYGGETAWVAGWLVTPNECTIADPIDHCVIDTACTDRLNVRHGPGGGFEKIGSLAHDAVGIHSTGWVSTDATDRIWVQIDWGSGVAWVAGWFLTNEPCTPWPGQPCACPANGTTAAMIHSVDVAGRMLDYDPIVWVWTGPADTDGYWENSDQTVLHMPIADAAQVMACPASDLLYCLPPDHIAYSIADLAQWVANDTQVGQNQNFAGEVPGHTGQLWLVSLSGCSVTEIAGRWVP